MSDWQKNKEARRTAYGEKLKDPRWQKQRLRILERDGWACQLCFNTESTLHIHHLYYEVGFEPWEYPAEALVTLCESCHTDEGEARPTEEKALLQMLRQKGFLANDLMCLSDGISRLPNGIVHPALPQALRFAMGSVDMLGHILNTYFVFLKELQDFKKPVSEPSAEAKE